MQIDPTDDDIADVRAALLAFYDESARALPWRQTRDPYAIWVSEIMAQQTRVETVVPYYERWLERFPDIAALADAPLDDVLKAWEGLGYYSRARNLHAAARLLRERHSCTVPDTYDALRALPGIGEYTAGAVSSIAYGARRAAVDGNVRRVLARLLDCAAPAAPMLRDVAAALVPSDRPGDFNQALMELGATTCTPKAPRCGRCPITRRCAAYAAGTQEDRPAPTLKRAIPVIDVATAVVRDPGGRLMIVRRPPRGLLAGMWAFPGAELPADADPAARALSLAREKVAASTDLYGGGGDMGATAHGPRALGVVEHVFSHRRERYHCFLIEATRAGRPGNGIAWIHETGSAHALPRAQQRIRSLALAEWDRQRTGV